MLLGVIACALAATSIYLWRELDQERTRNVELRARLESPPPKAAAVRTAEGAVSTPEAALPAPSPAIAVSVAGTTAPQQVTGKQEDWESTRRRLMSDPRYREVQREQTRLALAPRRANLIRLLGLSPEQADAVIDLQIEREWQQADMLDNPPTEELRQQQQRRAETQEKEYQAKLHAMLGAEKESQLQHYMETRQSRMQVDTFRTQLSGADALRDDQVEPLIEALQVERTKMRDELEKYQQENDVDGQSVDFWQRYGERQSELMKDMHVAMHSSAGAILSSPQLQQLDAMLDRELQKQQARLRMAKIQNKLDQ